MYRFIKFKIFFLIFILALFSDVSEANSDTNYDYWKFTVENGKKEPILQDNLIENNSQSNKYSEIENKNQKPLQIENVSGVISGDLYIPFVGFDVIQKFEDAYIDSNPKKMTKYWNEFCQVNRPKCQELYPTYHMMLLKAKTRRKKINLQTWQNINYVIRQYRW